MHRRALEVVAIGKRKLSMELQATLPEAAEHANHMLALEWVLKRSAAGREAVTYDELASAAEPTFGLTPCAPRAANLTPTRRTTTQ